MSVSATINLRVVDSKSGALIPPTKIIQVLLKNGWSAKRNGGACYLPLGDKDNFDWTSSNIDIPSLMEIFKKKEEQEELIGLVITWQEADIGGDLMLWSPKEMTEKKIHTSITLSLSINRKLLINKNELKITDVNWYTTNLLQMFNRCDMIVEYYTYEEHI